MTLPTYYNENDPFAADWIERLIAAGHLPEGDVDRRDIRDVAADDLVRYRACHLFAGIGGWPYALRLAGWPDEREVWTGSCPCQPFSQAGKRQGERDERHLWPIWHELIRECRPATVFGEQVASPLGRAWLSGVRLQMEALGYGVGAADLCAAGVGAPHIRQRLWFVADLSSPSVGGGLPRLLGEGRLANSQDADRRSPRASTDAGRRDEEAGGPGATVGLGQPHDSREDALERVRQGPPVERSGSPDPWGGLEWLPCSDGKLRPTQPGLFPLADGIPARVGKLRGAGNAIVPQLAAEFVLAYLES